MAKKTILDSKKNMVLNCIRLGMSKYRVYLLLELTDRQIETLDSDERFQRQIHATDAALERDLLEKYKSIVELSAQKGNPSAVQWLLSKVNPERFGNKIDVGTGETGSEKVSIYLPENGR